MAPGSSLAVIPGELRDESCHARRAGRRKAPPGRGPVRKPRRGSAARENVIVSQFSAQQFVLQHTLMTESEAADAVACATPMHTPAKAPRGSQQAARRQVKGASTCSSQPVEPGVRRLGTATLSTSTSGFTRVPRRSTSRRDVRPRSAFRARARVDGEARPVTARSSRSSQQPSKPSNGRLGSRTTSSKRVAWGGITTATAGTNAGDTSVAVSEAARSNPTQETASGSASMARVLRKAATTPALLHSALRGRSGTATGSGRSTMKRASSFHAAVASVRAATRIKASARRRRRALPTALKHTVSAQDTLAKQLKSHPDVRCVLLLLLLPLLLACSRAVDSRRVVCPCVQVLLDDLHQRSALQHLRLRSTGPAVRPVTDAAAAANKQRALTPIEKVKQTAILAKILVGSLEYHRKRQRIALQARIGQNQAPRTGIAEKLLRAARATPRSEEGSEAATPSPPNGAPLATEPQTGLAKLKKAASSMKLAAAARLKSKARVGVGGV